MSATKLLSAVAALAVLSCAATPTWSAPLSDEMSVRVSVADLNLDTAPGATTALARIRQAAREVCGAEPDYRVLGSAAAYRGCVRGAVDNAVASAHRPMLTEVAGAPHGATRLAVR